MGGKLSPLGPRLDDRILHVDGTFPKPMPGIPSEMFVRVSLIREYVVDDAGDRTFRSGNTPRQRYAIRDVGAGTPEPHLEQ